MILALEKQLHNMHMHLMGIELERTTLMSQVSSERFDMFEMCFLCHTHKDTYLAVTEIPTIIDPVALG